MSDGVEGAATSRACSRSFIGEGASGCASVAGPHAERGLLALDLVCRDDGAKLGAHLKGVVPSAAWIGIAGSLGSVFGGA